MRKQGLIKQTVNDHEQLLALLDEGFNTYESKYNIENEEQNRLYLHSVMKHFFLELSVEQIDIMCNGYVQIFLENLSKNQIIERTSFKNVKKEAERDKEMRA